MVFVVMCMHARVTHTFFSNNHVETAGALIYYTVNGTKPNPFQKIGEKFTYRYYKPFVLGPGKRTVKAMATSRFDLHNYMT